MSISLTNQHSQFSHWCLFLITVVTVNKQVQEQGRMKRKQTYWRALTVFYSGSVIKDTRSDLLGTLSSKFLQLIQIFNINFKSFYCPSTGIADKRLLSLMIYKYKIQVCIMRRPNIFRRVSKIAKSDYALRHVCLSVCPHRATRLPREGFWWNLIFETFSKICRKNSNFTKIRYK